MFPSLSENGKEYESVLSFFPVYFICLKENPMGSTVVSYGSAFCCELNAEKKTDLISDKVNWSA